MNDKIIRKVLKEIKYSIDNPNSKDSFSESYIQINIPEIIQKALTLKEQEIETKLTKQFEKLYKESFLEGYNKAKVEFEKEIKELQEDDKEIKRLQKNLINEIQLRAEQEQEQTKQRLKDIDVFTKDIKKAFVDMIFTEGSQEFIDRLDNLATQKKAEITGEENGN